MPRDKEYWTFVKTIMSQPTNGLPRRVFADWLDEHRSPKAAIKQREWARWIETAEIMWARNETKLCEVRKPATSHKRRTYKKYFGLLDRSKQGHMQEFELKPDGSIVLAPPSLNRGPHERDHILKGTLQARKKPRKRLSFQGSKSGRWSGKTPNPSNLPKSSYSELEGNPCSEIFLGSPDGTDESGQLFDFKTVRPAGKPLFPTKSRLMPHQEKIIERVLSLPKNARFAELYGFVKGKSLTEGSWGEMKSPEPEMMKHGVLPATTILPDTKEGWAQAIHLLISGIPCVVDVGGKLEKQLFDLKLGEPHEAVPSKSTESVESKDSGQPDTIRKWLPDTPWNV